MACAGGANGAATGRKIAVNAQLEATSLDPTVSASKVGEIAFRFGGRVARADTGVIELAVPVEVWPEAFVELRRVPEVTGGEQVWGQDITDRVAALTAELEAATGEDADRLRAQLAFREERVINAVIVIRIVR